MKEEISFEDFTKVDIRVGTIIEVNDFPKARKPAYQLKIDFGSLGVKKSSAQITDIYTKEELLNKQVTAIVNFKPRQIANFLSEVLVLGVYNTNDEVVLLQASKPVKNGEQVSQFLGLFNITKAPITPGIQPHKVNKNIINIDPQPLSITDNGGNNIANKTLRKLIIILGWLY